MRERRPATSANPVREYVDFEEFASTNNVTTGRFSVPYEGAPVDFLYSPIEGADTTVVFFHGSTQKSVDLPMHSGRRIMKDIQANRLAISDPSLTLDDTHELILSWFIGSSQQPKLQSFIESVIRCVLDSSESPNLIFMGGSGGGFASLEMSRRFPNSLALVMNPQTTLSRYYRGLVRHYLDTCWDGLESLSSLPEAASFDLAEAYPKELKHTIAYMQNTRDKHHVENHALPFMEHVGADHNVFMMLGAWGDPMGKGHVLPPNEMRRNILRQLVNSRGQWKETLLNLDFDHYISTDMIKEKVQAANMNLPTDHEIDVM